MAVIVPLAGHSPYDRVHELQEALVAARAADRIPDVILLLEHEPAITVGRAQQALANILDAGSIPVFPIKRGGDVTLHAPGQLVAYPIVQLTGERQDLRGHLRNLEQASMDLLTELGVPNVRDERNTGVWVPREDALPQKITSVGIAVRSWVTWHGLALNVDIDLSLFGRINPCGFNADVMTRLADKLPAYPSVPELYAPLAKHLLSALGLPEEPRTDALDELLARFDLLEISA